MFRVPVLQYLNWVGDVKRNDFKLKHQRITDGFVLFENALEIDRLKLLIDYHNLGESLPFEDGDYKGIAIYDNREHLLNVVFSNDDWYSAQCPACAIVGKDNNKNNLQIGKKGFKCLAGCSAKEVIKEFEKLLPESTDTTDLKPGQTLNDFVEENETEDEESDIEESTTPIMSRDEIRLDRARLVSTNDKKERYVHVDELEGGEFFVTIFNKNKQTGKVQKQQHRVKRNALRTLWVWVTKNCPVGETVKSSDIRAYLAEKHNVSVDAWASHAHRTVYFDTHYYPTKVLEWKRLVEYHHNGSITRLKEDFE